MLRRVSRSSALRAAGVLGVSLATAWGAAGVAAPGAMGAPRPTAPAPAWPSNGSDVPVGVRAIFVEVSGASGGAAGTTQGMRGCRVSATVRVVEGDVVTWITGANGGSGAVSSGALVSGGAGGAGAYGRDGGSGGSSAGAGLPAGGGGGGATAFEINASTKVIAGGGGGATTGFSLATACLENGNAYGEGIVFGGGARRANSMSESVAGGLGGSAPGQPAPPGTSGGSSDAISGAGVGGTGGDDSSTYGAGGGGGGGFAGGGGGAAGSAGSNSGSGAAGSNMVLPPAAGDARPEFATEEGASASVRIVHVQIADRALTSATQGSAYRTRLTASFDGAAIPSAPRAWMLGLGVLPPGLTLNDRTGVVAGTPTAAGQYTFTVVASHKVQQDANGQRVWRVRAASEATYTLTVADASRQVQFPVGWTVPREVACTGSTVLLPSRTMTNAGEPVRLRVQVRPLARIRPAGNADLYRIVAGADGSRTLVVTALMPVSVRVTWYANAAPGYLAWKATRTCG